MKFIITMSLFQKILKLKKKHKKEKRSRKAKKHYEFFPAKVVTLNEKLGPSTKVLVKFHLQKLLK